MLDILFYILIGVILGILSGFIPGFSSINLSTLIIAYGLISQNYYLAVIIIAIEISFSFFEFLSPMIFGVGNEATSLVVDTVELREESLKNGINMVVSGGLIGILISLPMLFLADKIYPVVYSSLKPLLGWILLVLCFYMIWIERNVKQKILSSIIFCLSGLVGLIVQKSGLVSSEYLMIPIFIGLYGFSSLISKRRKGNDSTQDFSLTEKIRVVAVAFITSIFASLIQGMKRGQTSALALQLGKIKREEVLFILPMISLAFTTMSIFVLDSTGKIRSSLAYVIQEVMGNLYFSQTVLFAGVVAVSACISVSVLILLTKPIGKIFSRINERYLKFFGFCTGILLIINFTGIYGILLAFTTTCIGILSSRLRVRSVHLMGVLLLPSIVAMIL